MRWCFFTRGELMCTSGGDLDECHCIWDIWQKQKKIQNNMIIEK